MTNSIAAQPIQNENASPSFMNKQNPAGGDPLVGVAAVKPSKDASATLKLKLKKSMLVEVSNKSTSSPVSNRPYSPEHYTAQSTDKLEDLSLTMKTIKRSASTSCAQRYEDDSVEGAEDNEDNGEDSGLPLQTEDSGKSMQRSQSDPQTSLVFKSKDGSIVGEKTQQLPAGSGIDAIKTKRSMKAGEGAGLDGILVEESSDLYCFFKSIRIKDVVALEYSRVMQEQGYDDVASLEDATEVDLELLGVKPGHAKRMKRAAEVKTKGVPSADEQNAAGDQPNFSKTVGGKVRGKSAGDSRSVLEKDLRRAAEIKSKGRAASAKRAVRKELTLKYDPAASVNDMDYAKQKLHAQAAKIRELEAKLAESDMDKDKQGKDEVPLATTTPTVTAGNKNPPLTAQERLQAHMDRKKEEEDRRSKGDEWEKPPPQESVVKKVKPNEALLDRLTSKNSVDRRERQKARDNAKKAVAKATAASRKAAPAVGDGIKSPVLNMRSKHGKDIAEAARRTAPTLGSKKAPLTAEEKKAALMSRLSLTVEQRRAMNKAQGGNSTDSKVRKALQGHKLKKKAFNMADEFSEGSKSKPDTKCETCGSTENCEEDVDNAGTFYCQKCWDDYEVDEGGEHGQAQQLQRQGGQNDVMKKKTTPRRSTSSLKELKNKPTPIETQGTETGLPASPPTKQEMVKQLKSPPPPPAGTEAGRIPNNLCIIHDNPQLANAVSAGMSCMIETKDPKNTKSGVRIILGKIEASTTVRDNERGTECLKLKDLIGYCVDTENVETRPNKDGTIIEYKLDEQGMVELSGESAAISVEAFLEGCKARVDVILDPHCEGGCWYPLKERHRKMAPQFKSNGVGYIRLGDDMSKNGVAFLSSDDCVSFFSSKNVSPTAESVGRETDFDDEVAARSDETGSSGTEDDDELDFGDEVINENAGDLIRKLQDSSAIGSNVASLKWHEKVDLITKLGKVVSLRRGRGEAGVVLTILQDIMNGKNVNVHVLRASVVSIGRIGWGLKDGLLGMASWRTIMIELLKLLKSKQVSIEAKQTLKMIHGRCFFLKNVLPLVGECLGLGKAGRVGGGGGKGKGGKAKDKAGKAKKKVMAGAATPKSGSGVGSTTEIIEWLGDAVEEERFIKKGTGLDSNVILVIANIFLSYVENRDVKCRRAAQDGLVSTLVLGVAGNFYDKLGILELIEGLKQTSAKIHGTIVKMMDEEVTNRAEEIMQETTGASGSASSGKRRADAAASTKATAVSDGYGDGSGEKMDGANVDVDEAAMKELKGRWNEVEYLLRKPVRSSEDIDSIVKEAQSGLFFLKKLDSESSRLGMLRGTLSRCVLPYDENTSTLDQANVANGPPAAEDLEKVDLEEEVLSKMRNGAVALRGLVRVKIADDNDLDLAALALQDVLVFFDKLVKQGSESKVKVMDLLKAL